MGTKKWFDRQFAFDFGPDSYPAIYQRLKQAPDNLSRVLTGLPEEILVFQPDGGWSIKEHAGHLSVLEPIWQLRFVDIRESKPTLTPADLTNRATTEGNFNQQSVSTLLETFATLRKATLAMLDLMDPADEGRTSLHPRMKQPMRLIDHAYFIAEHDDHHILRIGEILVI
jgi:uncharacterized damage-inducible protein DinB